MKRVLPVIAVWLVACGASGSDNKTSDGGVSSQDMGAATDLGCFQPITLVESAASAPEQIIATSLDSSNAMPTWTVVDPSGAVLPITYLDGSQRKISVDAAQPGTYTFDLRFSDGGCSGGATIVVKQALAITQAYRLRLTPPASSGLPQQDLLVEVAGNTPQTAYTLALASGSTLSGILTGPSGAIAGQVALSPQSGPPVLDAFGTSGQFAVPFRLDGTYSLLLQPADPSLAPHLVGPTDGATLSTGAFGVGAGVVVSGLVRDAALQPLVGANVALHSGLRPSSLGVSDATGSYAVHMEPGTASLLVSATGWPDITLDNVVVDGAATLGIDQKLTRLGVTWRVVRSDGTTPVANARVSLRSVSIASAAVVHTSSGDRPASGRAHLDLVTASDGTVTAQLPASTYDVLVDPGTLLTGSDGITGLHVAVSSSGTVTLVLAPTVALSGTVLDPAGAGVGSVRVRATPQAGDAVTTTTGSDGTFTLSGLGAGLAVTVDVSPAASARLAGVTQKIGDPMTLGATLPSALVIHARRGLELAGTVVTPGGLRPSGVGIDVLCASCGDATPLFHTDTATGGGYTLYVPDPGVSAPTDAGVGLD